MARKIILLLCLSIGLGSMYQGICNAEEPGEKRIELESGFYYTIEKGDTLWDISEHFFDSAWVWPDVWQKNDQIANPHWIYPGERIRLYNRQDLERETETFVEPGAELGMAGQSIKSRYYYCSAINTVGFIREKPVSHVGSIFKVKEDKVMISLGDSVYIRPSGNVTFKPGDRFTVLRTLSAYEEKDSKEFIGIQHYLVGVVEITDVEPEYATASVLQSFRPIEINDLLIPHEPRSPYIKLIESKKGLNGKIIIAEEHLEMIADTVVFIDKGRKDGIKVGQAYSIYYQDKGYLDPKGEESIMLSPIDIGKILVLRTEEATATAIVTTAKKAIDPGAPIRTPIN